MIISKDGWLKENIAPLLALLWTMFTFYVLTLVLLKEVKAAENIAFLIINTVSNICMIIVGYHFGSSAGSKAKQDALEKLSDGTSTSSDSTTTSTTNIKTQNEGFNNTNIK